MASTSAAVLTADRRCTSTQLAQHCCHVQTDTILFSLNNFNVQFTDQRYKIESALI
jgi:hypothetical protein